VRPNHLAASFVVIALTAFAAALVFLGVTAPSPDLGRVVVINEGASAPPPPPALQAGELSPLASVAPGRTPGAVEAANPPVSGSYSIPVRTRTTTSPSPATPAQQPAQQAAVATPAAQQPGQQAAATSVSSDTTSKTRPRKPVHDDGDATSDD
jgi:uncharacterized iron-regulated membrane protein